MGTSAEELLLKISGDAESGKKAVQEMTDHVASMGQSFVARVAEGVLLHDAIEKVVDAVKEGIMAFPELVEHTIATGNSLFEMSLKTGASVENLSKLRYVASQTGLDFNAFGNILFKMEQALGASGAKADEMQKHLDVLGLNLKTLKDEKPDQAFIDIMSALEEIPNRADQAAAGMAIFGKGFKEMAGLTQESITDLMKEADDLGLVMSTETAAAAHAAEVGFKGFSMQLEAAGMEVASTVLPALVALTKLVSGEFHSAMEAASHPVVDLKQTVEDVIMTMLDWTTVGINTAQFLDHAFEGTKAMLFDIEAKVVAVGLAFVNMALSAAEVANKIPGMRGDFTGLASSLQDTSTWLGGFKDGLQKESDGALDAAAKHDQFFTSLTAGIGNMKAHFGEAFTKAGEEIDHFASTSKNAFGGVGADVEGGAAKVDKFAAAMTDLMSAGTSWRATLDGLDGAVVEAAAGYLTAGVSANTLKEIYGLTETEMKALQSAVKDEIETQKLWGEIHKETFKLAADHEKAWRDEAQKTADAINRGLAAEVTAYVQARHAEEDADLGGVAAAVKAIERKRDAAVVAVQKDLELDSAFRDSRLRQIQAAADREIAIANGTSDDIIAITHSLGLATQDELDDQVEKWRTVYETLAEDGTASWEVVYAAEQRYEEALKRAGGDASASFKQMQHDLGDLANAFDDLAGRAGGSFGDVLTDISQVLKGIDTVDKGMEKFQKGVESGNVVQEASGIVQGLSGIGQATEGGGVKGIAGGALSGMEMGASIGTMIMPGIGTAIGASVGAIGGAIVGIARSFGASAAEKAGRTVEADFEKQFGGFDQMLAAVGQAYSDTGRGAAQAQTDVRALMDAEKQGGDAVKGMIDKINLAFADQKTKAAAVSTAVDGILATAQTVGGSFPEAMKPLVEQLAALPGLTEQERKALMGLTADVKPNFVDLTNTAKDYGLTLTDLGPAFEQADISGRADKILTDFGNLDKAGANSDSVLHGMGKSINTLINDAIKYGSTLPTALKPLAEQLAKTGQLTDEAGNKFDDLSGLKFDDAGDPLATGMKTLTDALNRLGDILSPTSPTGLAAKATSTAAAIGAALAGIPDKHVNIIYDRAGDSDTAYAAGGGYVTAAGVQYFGGGGPVMPMFIPRGPDVVPAMLSVDELVMTPHDQALVGSLVAAASRGASSGVGRPGWASSSALSAGGITVNVDLTVEGSLWRESDLIDAVSQGIANKIQQAGALPLGVRR